MFITFPLKKYGSDIVKLILSCLGVFIFIYLLRHNIPSYNSESLYFPILEEGSEDENNDKRIKFADEILNKFDWNILKTKENLNLSISIVAADRKNGYLIQSVAYLLQQLQNWDKIPMISICNVEPKIFDELKKFVDKLPIHSINQDRMIDYSLNNDDGRIRKEAEDYWNCLEAVHKSSGVKADFVLLIEDDALPIPYLGTLMESIMSQLLSEKYKHIDYVKLFHPWRLRRIPFLFQAISFAIAIGATVCFIVFRRFSFILIFIIAFVAYISIQRSLYCEIFADFRFHVTSSSYIIPPESCCTPGVFFRSASIPSMLSILKNQPISKGHAKDHILDESPFTGKATDFNYFVHIGHFSSVRQKNIALESLIKNL